MYHYVNEFAGSITVSPVRFKEHCRVLAEKGWRGVGLDEAEAFLLAGEPLPAKSLLITFDDGYCDNYCFALPALHAYGHRGAVFAVSQRLEPGGAPRARLEELLSGTADIPLAVRRPVEETPQGFSSRQDVFLNHAEARLMQEQGVLTLASHTRGHYGVYVGPEYGGFFQPGPRLRTFYRTESPPVWGMPEFAVKPGLLHRAFLPNPDLQARIAALVPQEDTAAAVFFAQERNVAELSALVASFRDKLGRYETDEEQRERMWREIGGGKAELESILGRPVRSLCWPWGRYGKEAFSLARDAGFQVFFTTAEGANPPGRPEAVGRFKGKDKSGSWLAWRAWIYSRPLLGKLYAQVRI